MLANDVARKDVEIGHANEKAAALENTILEHKAENKRIKAVLEEIKTQKFELEKAEQRTMVLIQSLEKDKAELEERERMAEERILELEFALAETKAAHESVENL